MNNKEVIKFLLEDLSFMCSDDEKVRRPYYEQAIRALKIDCEACVYKDYFDDNAGVLGQWIYSEQNDKEKGYGGYCSICKCDMPIFIDDWKYKYCETKYCPHCGAKMLKEGDENA